MKKMLLKVVVLAGVLVFAFLFMSANICAFGVAASYWKGNPMALYPGETKATNLNIQNGAGASESANVRMNVAEGGEIARFESAGHVDYVVPAGASLDVPLIVSMPSNALIGSKYRIRIDVLNSAGGGAGQVALGTGMVLEFDANAVEKPSAGGKPDYTLYYWIIGILIGLIILACIAIKILGRKRISFKELKKRVNVLEGRFGLKK